MVECGLIGSSFCKVYLPSQSSHHLCIPSAFVKKFNDDFFKNATLGDTSGNLWHTESEKNENGVFLKLGWEKFAEDHSLGYGDFLEFVYNGNSVFTVKVFGKNGCIKKQGLSKRDNYKELRVITKPINLEDRPNEGMTCRETISKSKTKAKNSSDATQRKAKRTTLSIVKEEPNEGHTCLVPVHVSEPKAKGSCDATQRKSRETTLRICEPNNAKASSEIPMKRNPHFIGSVSPKMLYNLYIPQNVLKKNCLEKSEKVMVFDTQDGKRWLVKIVVRVDGRYTFGGGWRSFYVENSLKPQDKCRFEFKYHKNGTLSKKVLARIFRAKN